MEPQISQDTEQNTNGLSNNRDAAALAHATMLSEQLLRQQNTPVMEEEPVEDAPVEEDPVEEEVPEDNKTEKGLQRVKEEIRSMKEEILRVLESEDDEDNEEDNEQKE